MIKEAGRVVAIEDGAVWVETIRRSTCQSCSARKGCGHGILANAGSGRRHHARVLPGTFSLGDIHLDDQVEVSVPERVLVQAALVVYLVPLVTLLLGALLASEWLPEFALNGDLSAVVGAALGFGLGVLLVRLHSLMHHNDSEAQPIIVSVATPSQLSESPQAFIPS